MLTAFCLAFRILRAAPVMVWFALPCMTLSYVSAQICLQSTGYELCLRMPLWKNSSIKHNSCSRFCVWLQMRGQCLCCQITYTSAEVCVPRGKRWGAEMDLGQRTVVEGVTPLAAELRMLIARMQQVPCLRCFQPNEANAIDYRKDLGHWLKPHVDDRCMAVLLLWVL